MPAFLTQANPQQQEAILTTDGPVLIIAGPGSGKTFTLVERVVYLITEKNVTPESLLVVTFTDKAAQELRTRVSNRLTQLGVRFNLNEMYLGTFHSICLRWLEEYREFTRLKRNFTMMDQFDQQYFLYQRLSAYNEISGIESLIDQRSGSPWHRSEKLLKLLNSVSEEALNVTTLLAAPDLPVRVLGECYQLYQSQLEAENALDFSTIQLEALKLLRTYPEARQKLQHQISHLMVDEYQDTNTIQELILEQLSTGDLPNLCVVGDDDQGLYRFRGATIRNILEFKDRFPAGTCKQVTLTINYRSHPGIIDLYNKWIGQQNWEADGIPFRYEKQIVPPPDKPFPTTATALTVSGGAAQNWHEEVLAFLHTLRDHGGLTNWNQVAFLFHSVKNRHAVELAKYLEDKGIPVYAPRSNQFFDREEIRLIIGAFTFLFPQFPTVRKWKEDAELEIWDYYDRECFAAFGTELRKPENNELRQWCAFRRRDHFPLTKNADYAFSGLFYDLLRFPLFSRYLDEDLLKSGVRDGRAMRNLATFSQLINKFEYLHHISVLTPDYLDKNIRDLFNGFLRFLKDGGIDEYEDESEYAPSGCVSFLTIHQSKGLEFPVVLVGSMESAPRKRYSALDETLAEGYLHRPVFEPFEMMKYFDFWRLFYTAFSRAQNVLALTCQENRVKGTKVPSKHFLSLYDSLPSWRSPAFRPDLLTLAQVKEVDLKREYSFTSHIALYENCAEQYRFFKELEFAPVRTGPVLFGTVVHQTIEDIHKAVLRGQVNLLSEDQVAAWFDTNYAFLTKRERVYLTPQQKRIALTDVLRYYRRHNGNWERIKEAEVDVSLVKDSYILAGTVDLIEGDNNTVEIIDFKSERKPDINSPEDRERIERYRRQLEVYAHIVEERTGIEVSKTHLYYMREEDGIPTISFDKNSRSIERTVAKLDAVVERIEEKDFRIPERPARLCKECDMRAYCDAKTWKFRGSV